MVLVLVVVGSVVVVVLVLVAAGFVSAGSTEYGYVRRYCKPLTSGSLERSRD